MRMLSLAIVLALICPMPAESVDLRLMTGPEGSTFYRLGNEISRAADSSGVHLEVLASTGTWENIVALFNSDTEFAVFQIDAFARAAKNLYRNASLDITEDIHVLMPLYLEEIHVIKSRHRALDFAHRDKFAIACGVEDSGSCLSAAVIGEVYGKQFTPVYGSFEAALNALARGEVDLVIMTADAPSPLLIGRDDIDLVSLPRLSRITDYYSWTDLGPQDYPWLERDIDTFAVRTVLATMIHQQDGLANDLVGAVHFSLLLNEDRLKKGGDPKWNDVQFYGYIDGLSHEGALRSLRVCTVVRSFGYTCGDLTAAGPGGH